MTQIDLPQLSLQRYVDLLKRRRWQLLPVSLLGLLVGAVVAFLIPRFYVAEASVEHQPVAGEMERDEDPFRRIVDSAQDTIPLAVGKAMESLKWPEALVADPSARTLLEKEVKSRIVVLDSNAHDKNRTYAHIRVFYRDRDARRAADLANALVDTWIQDRVGKLRSSHQEQLQRANEDVTEWDRTYERLLHEKRDLEVRYRVRADLDSRLQQEDARLRQDAHRELRDRLRTKEAERVGLASQLAKEQELLALMPERVAPNLKELVATVKGNVELERLVLQLTLTQLGIGAWGEGTRNRANAEREIARLKTMVYTLLGVEVDEKGLVANRQHTELTAKVASDAQALERLTAELQNLQAEVAAEQQLIEDLAEGISQIEAKKKDLAAAETRRADAAQRQKTQAAILATLEQKLPVQPLQRATPPPHPTDPNILVVALIGAVLGLGVAIGLILLLDLLQGSFKTPDEVERGLGVPVLGGMSHLETEEERVSVARGRRRGAVAAFGFVALVVVVVTIYYQAPTRLPPFVRDLLTMLLGS